MKSAALVGGIPLTSADHLWIAEWVPFLMFGTQNVSLFAFPGMCRKRYFSRLGNAIWTVHVHLVLHHRISMGESTAIRHVLEEYLVGAAHAEV